MYIQRSGECLKNTEEVMMADQSPKLDGFWVKPAALAISVISVGLLLTA
jgi:hypothetical protein